MLVGRERLGVPAVRVCHGEYDGLAHVLSGTQYLVLPGRAIRPQILCGIRVVLQDRVSGPGHALSLIHI